MSHRYTRKELAEKEEMDSRIDELARLEALSDARKEGISIGFQQGRINTLREAALKKRASGHSNALIAEHLELSVSELVEMLSGAR